MTVLWILAMVLMAGAGVCAAMTSCYREQGDPKAQSVSQMAMGLLVLAVIVGGIAWRLSEWTR